MGKGDNIVDSAADESCWPVGEGDAYPTKTASRKMVLRTANGGDMQHYGKKEIIFKYEGGEDKDPVGLKFQVTDVRKPLMSVAKICDTGPKVTFTSHGGEIVDLKTGDITKFDRVDDVYRLEVNLPDTKVYEADRTSEEGFRRRGM